MKYILIAFLFFGINNLQSQGIEFFEGSWEETLTKAKGEDKLIFVDAYTTWCGPCKRMAKNVFTKEKVGKDFNARFINQKIDMENPDNMAFINKYPVTAYPTLFFINGDGEVVHKTVGGKDVDKLLAFANEAAKKDDKSVRYVDAYEKGDRDIALMINYVSALNNVGKPSLKISNEYWNSKPQITEEEKATFLMAAVTEADSKLFEALIERKDLAKKLTDEKSYNQTIIKSCNATIAKGIEFEIYDLVEEGVAKYKAAAINPSEYYGEEAALQYYSGTGRVDEYFVSAEKYLKKIKKKDETRLLDFLSTVKTNYKSQERGEKLLMSGYKSLAKHFKSWKNYVEYSKVLTSFDKNKDALKYAEKALDMLTEEESKKYKSSIESLIKHIKSQNVG